MTDAPTRHPLQLREVLRKKAHQIEWETPAFDVSGINSERSPYQLELCSDPDLLLDALTDETLIGFSCSISWMLEPDHGSCLPPYVPAYGFLVRHKRASGIVGVVVADLLFRHARAIFNQPHRRHYYRFLIGLGGRIKRARREIEGLIRLSPS